MARMERMVEKKVEREELALAREVLVQAKAVEQLVLEQVVERGLVEMERVERPRTWMARNSIT